jgi:hypothetical protein
MKVYDIKNIEIGIAETGEIYFLGIYNGTMFGGFENKMSPYMANMTINKEGIRRTYGIDTVNYIEYWMADEINDYKRKNKIM